MQKLPPGIYERLVTTELHERLGLLDSILVDRGSLDAGDAHEILARHLGDLARRLLRAAGGEDATALVRQVDLANRMAQAITAIAPEVLGRGDFVSESRDVLQAIATSHSGPGPIRFPVRPEIPLSVSALLVNGRDQPRIGVEVQRELASADHVDLL
jgi:hypothetical protein